MKIATLSFELQDDNMAISSDQRAQTIVDIIEKNKPELLLCAGWAVETKEQLIDIARKCKVIGSTTTALIEVENIVINPEPEFIKRNHKMHVISNSNELIELGEQCFRSSSQLNEDKTGTLISSLEENIQKRMFKLNDYNCLALCCGELNILQGRNNISVRSKKIEQAILEADIVLNPTHDGMANYGTLKKKREFLSQSINNRNRIYINSSNWNTKKQRKTKLGEVKKFAKQSPMGIFMHSVWVDGKRVDEQIIHDSKNEYHLRIYNINF